MDLWPILALEPVAVDVASQELAHVDPFLDQGYKVISEEEVEGERVLVLKDVLDDLVESPQLVVLNRNVDS